jgi:hypothetical protein
MSSSTVELKFGVELELLVRPNQDMTPFLATHNFNNETTTDATNQKAKRENRQALRSAIVDVLELSAIQAHLVMGDYQKWTVLDDTSLDDKDGFCKYAAYRWTPSYYFE